MRLIADSFGAFCAQEVSTPIFWFSGFLFPVFSVAPYLRVDPVSPFSSVYDTAGFSSLNFSIRYRI